MSDSIKNSQQTNNILNEHTTESDQVLENYEEGEEIISIDDNVSPKEIRRSVSNDDRERIITKLIAGCSVKMISSMYNLKYQTVNTVVKRYLESGKIIASKRGGDRRSKLSLEIKESLLT
ncbi:hypothetical protein HZS_6985 [Henneguya salminicola]|nr:hypothetical protein HZS_6985 [Henneguya salminicola]